MNFKELMMQAKAGSPAASRRQMYRPLLLKESIVDSVLDEDLYQEQCMALLHRIEVFKV